MSAELEFDSLDEPQRFSFIAFRQYLQHCGFDSGSIRYRATASLSHPAGELSAARLTLIGDKPKVTVDVSLMGLYGTTSPLPAFYTERILGFDGDGSSEQATASVDADYEEGKDLKQFYDLFNHQAISLFYDAWNKYRIAGRLSDNLSGNGNTRDNKPQQASDEFSTALLSIWGIDDGRLASLKYLTLPRLMPLAGLLATRCASIDLLEQALNQLFTDVMITTQSLVSGVTDIPKDQLNGLGQNNVTLSESLVLGQTVTDCSGVVIDVKLSSPEQLVQWLPGGDQNETARELIALLFNTPHDYQMTLNVGDIFKGRSQIGNLSTSHFSIDNTAIGHNAIGHNAIGLNVKDHNYKKHINEAYSASESYQPEFAQFDHAVDDGGDQSKQVNQTDRALGLGMGLGETKNAVINI
ncbi:type VI secretion system baseplate subunit TssG [Alkalimarinus sediminis]|uniref:Type VI secretion system baseplate subunit TssG n=1 Tax=Alkalimarinus sediminis TaxID=1632866 RepID=A0A9E8HFR4_9ALTE|nr:type VI secretion system baseplate subunit TssG [Alkalimarinus sediminis]UZW73405.1 type VI secretion system baseplate subunit TssG [Alkalimarinus sediminis]